MTVSDFACSVIFNTCLLSAEVLSLLGAQWLSGRVLDETEEPQVQASLVSLCYVLEQD